MIQYTFNSIHYQHLRYLILNIQKFPVNNQSIQSLLTHNNKITVLHIYVYNNSLSLLNLLFLKALKEVYINIKKCNH